MDYSEELHSMCLPATIQETVSYITCSSVYLALLYATEKCWGRYDFLCEVKSLMVTKAAFI